MLSAYDGSLAETSASHGPELRATLVRAAALRFATEPATRDLLAKAAADPDAGVRFIALAASSAATSKTE
jgi:hypothetical protein